MLVGLTALCAMGLGAGREGATFYDEFTSLGGFIFLWIVLAIGGLFKGYIFFFHDSKVRLLQLRMPYQ